ncbi:hypothetical protein LJR175_008249 [Variovorax sp. LjRoot175]|uniref:HNH endonuclease n=1 Tax=Variovorax sp. LjRoot175 TaxID=3342276 RepID=UPI003ED0A807
MALPTLTPDDLARMFRELEERAAARPKRITDVMLMDYQGQYLPSALWKEIKERVLERDQRICQSCGGRGSVVHHRSYERDVLEGRNDAMLATVCSGCHNIIHFTDDGKPRPEEEWDAILLAGQHQTDIPPIGKIDLRKPVLPRPPNYERMTARQLGLFRLAHLQAFRDKIEANRLRAEKKALKAGAHGHNDSA